MKIRRIKNSLQLRLTHKEVADFYQRGEVKSVPAFGAGSQQLTNFLVKAPVKRKRGVSTTFMGSEIRGMVPETLAGRWAVAV